MSATNDLVQRRRERLRFQLRRKSGGRPRLSVHRSSKQIYAQVIDDEAGRTLASASTLEKDLRGKLKTGATVDAATMDCRWLDARMSLSSFRWPGNSGIRSNDATSHSQVEVRVALFGNRKRL